MAPGDLLADRLALLRPLAEQAGVTFEAAIAEDVPWLELDRVRLGQVVANLLGNAIKFSPAGTTVRVALAVTESLRDLVFTVRTDGTLDFVAGACRSLLDREPESLVGRPREALWAAADADEARLAALGQAWTAAREGDAEVLHLDLLDTRRTPTRAFDLLLRLLRDERGRVVAEHGSLRDTSERRAPRRSPAWSST